MSLDTIIKMTPYKFIKKYKHLIPEVLMQEFKDDLDKLFSDAWLDGARSEHDFPTE